MRDFFQCKNHPNIYYRIKDACPVCRVDQDKAMERKLEIEHQHEMENRAEYFANKEAKIEKSL